MHKQFLLKEREGITVASSLTNYNLNGNVNTKTTIITPTALNDYSSDTTLESLGYPNETVDFQNVTAGSGVANNSTDIIANHNAVYYKNLVQPCNARIGYNQAWATTGILQMIARPTDGIWNCKNYLPTNTPMSIDLKVASLNKFFGQASGDNADAITAVIKNVSLMLCRVKPTQETAVAVNSILLERPFIYNILNSRTESQYIATQGSATTMSFSGVLNGVVPNVVVISLVTKGAFDRPPADSASVHWLDTHPMSSGLLRKMNKDVNPFTNIGGTDLGVPKVTSIVVTSGSRQVPKNQPYCNWNDTYLTQIFVQRTYDAYVSQCMDSDRPFLSFSHWKNCYTPYVFNLTNDDNGLVGSTDETQTGGLNIQISFADKTIEQYMFVTGLYYSEVSINNARSVTKIGY
jgi:hypothetical protein